MARKNRSRSAEHRRLLDMNHYVFRTPAPRRATDATSAYVVRRRASAYPIAQRTVSGSRAGSSQKAPLQLAIAIVGAIVLVPLFVITPLVIAVMLNEYFPIVLR